MIPENNIKPAESFENPPIEQTFKVYIFNYTNINDYLRNPRNNKIKVEQVGPYVYKEFGSRVNLQFDDQKITFNVR